METRVMLSEKDQKQYIYETRKLIGLLARLEDAAIDSDTKQIWGCNRAYVQGILRQLKRTFNGQGIRYGQS